MKKSLTDYCHASSYLVLCGRVGNLTRLGVAGFSQLRYGMGLDRTAATTDAM